MDMSHITAKHSSHSASVKWHVTENMITIKNVPLEKTSPRKLPIFQFKN
jgi:hypothetical protein